MGQVALTSPGKVTYWRRFIMSKRLTKGNSTLKQGSRVSGRHGGFLRRHGAENPGFGEDWRSLASILQLAASLVDRGNIVVFPCISTHFHSFPPVSSFRHGPLLAKNFPREWPRRRRFLSSWFQSRGGSSRMARGECQWGEEWAAVRIAMGSRKS